MYNEAAGWCLILIGLLSGAVLGMGFHRESFMGGYGSWQRRLVRLGHIAFVMLGVLNLLFAQSAAAETVAAWGMWGSATSWAWIAGGVLMPTTCMACGFRKELKSAFALPVVLLVFACGATAYGAIAGALWASGGSS